jgi:hypothetical protein
MVSVLASSVVDRGFEPRSGQTKNNKGNAKRGIFPRLKISPGDLDL